MILDNGAPIYRLAPLSHLSLLDTLQNAIIQIATDSGSASVQKQAFFRYRQLFTHHRQTLKYPYDLLLNTHSPVQLHVK